MLQVSTRTSIAGNIIEFRGEGETQADAWRDLARHVRFRMEVFNDIAKEADEAAAQADIDAST